jgi:hypothetical protein
MEFLLRLELETATKRMDVFDIRNLVEDKIKAFFKRKKYGKDIDCYMQVLRAQFDPFRNPVKQFNRKEKTIVLSWYLDPEEFMKASKEQLTKMVSQSVVDTLDRYSELRIKPKDFNVQKLSSDLRDFLQKENYFQ